MEDDTKLISSRLAPYPMEGVANIPSQMQHQAPGQEEALLFLCTIDYLLN